ncbi:MAG TPA: hypothetical protein VN428_13765 [Bryobacteraceae bacterium]|nr:hypothetical protein [Bryobacteraceae bacterium]
MLLPYGCAGAELGWLREISKSWTVETAVMCMRQWRDDPHVMGILRRLLGDTSIIDIHLLSDEEVFKKVAVMLVHGDIFVLRQDRLARGRFSTQAEQASAPPPAAPQRKASAPAPPPPDANTFPPNHDQAAQAATLRGAAETGAAFCEECERQRGAAAGE